MRITFLSENYVLKNNKYSNVQISLFGRKNSDCHVKDDDSLLEIDPDNILGSSTSDPPEMEHGRFLQKLSYYLKKKCPS